MTSSVPRGRAHRRTSAQVRAVPRTPKMSAWMCDGCSAHLTTTAHTMPTVPPRDTGFTLRMFDPGFSPTSSRTEPRARSEVLDGKPKVRHDPRFSLIWKKLLLRAPRPSRCSCCAHSSEDNWAPRVGSTLLGSPSSSRRAGAWFLDRSHHRDKNPTRRMVDSCDRSRSLISRRRKVFASRTCRARRRDAGYQERHHRPRDPQGLVRHRCARRPPPRPRTSCSPLLIGRVQRHLRQLQACAGPRSAETKVAALPAWSKISEPFARWGSSSWTSSNMYSAHAPPHPGHPDAFRLSTTTRLMDGRPCRSWSRDIFRTRSVTHGVAGAAC